jgi:TolB-like protein/Tfp pilus assembly protein PilF
MKRCPQCNRVETDEALKFCRVDGATLVSESSSTSGGAGSAKFGFASAASEIETSILPHTTDAGVGPATEPTTVLPAPPGSQRGLTQPKRLRAVMVVAACAALVVVAIIIIGGYFYSTHNSRTAIQSIAVMPFVNASGSADVEYLSDGLTESLINSLSQLPNLSVKARSTVFRYKGRDISPQQVGSELSVQAVLNGRVVQRGDQLTLSLDLVNARTGDQIWGQQYNRKVSELPSMQAEIANDVSQKLRTQISREDRQKLIRGFTTNPEAYLLYLRGRFHTAKYTKEGLAKGVEYFNQAIAMDPAYALAYDGLADNYIAAADWFMASNEALPKAGSAARKALEIDENLPEAHTSLAIVHWWFDWDWPAATKEFKRAIELNSNDARTHAFYGWFLIALGQSDAGVAESRRAQALDPLSVETNALVGQNLHFARRYDEAIQQLRSTIDMDANYWLAHSVLGRSYEQQGKLTEAIAEFQRALDLETDVPENYAMLAHAYALAGKKSESEKLLSQLREMSAKRHVPPYNVAIIYAGLGDKDQALAWLERAYADRSFYLTWLKYDPQLDSLRSDPRFADLLRRVGLPQ